MGSVIVSPAQVKQILELVEELNANDYSFVAQKDLNVPAKQIPLTAILAGLLHNDFGGKQGGATDEYYHLDLAGFINSNFTKIKDTYADLLAVSEVIRSTYGLYFVKDTSTFYEWNGSVFIPIALGSSVSPGAFTNNLGSWDASTNTPTLSDGSGSEGDYYTISVDGTTTIDGNTDWHVNDIIWFNEVSGTWQKIDNYAGVATSVWMDDAGIVKLINKKPVEIETAYADLVDDLEILKAFVLNDTGANELVFAKLRHKTGNIGIFEIGGYAQGKLQLTRANSSLTFSQLVSPAELNATYYLYNGYQLRISHDSTPDGGAIHAIVIEDQLRTEQGIEFLSGTESGRYVYGSKIEGGRDNKYDGKIIFKTGFSPLDTLIERMQIDKNGRISFNKSGTLTDNFNVSIPAEITDLVWPATDANKRFSPTGLFSGVADTDYVVKITGVSPRTFQWSDDGGSTFNGSDITIVSDSEHSLNNGISVIWHLESVGNVADEWTFTAKPPIADVLTVDRSGVTGLGLSVANHERTAKFWYDTIDTSVATASNYLFDDASNEIEKLGLVVQKTGTWKIDIAKFQYNDKNGDATQDVIVSIYKNGVTIMSSTVTIPVFSGASSGIVDLTTGINASLNSFVAGDQIEIYVSQAAATGGSQLYGDVYFNLIPA